MSTHAYREVLNQVQHLTPDEKFQLLEDLAAVVHHQSKTRPKRHNIMEFGGFAKELWKGVDVEKYINEERDSWRR